MVHHRTQTIFHFSQYNGQLTQWFIMKFSISVQTLASSHSWFITKLSQFSIFIHTLVSSYKANITKLTQSSSSIHTLASSHCSVHYIKRTLTSISVYALVSSHSLIHLKTQTICHLCPWHGQLSQCGALQNTLNFVNSVDRPENYRNSLFQFRY